MTASYAAAKKDAETFETGLARTKIETGISTIVHLAAGTRGKIELGTVCCADGKTCWPRMNTDSQTCLTATTGYKKVKEEADDCADMIPFQKRDPYEIENEFRVIWEKGAEEKQLEIKIDVPEVITKVTLSPNMPDPLFITLKAFLEKHFKVRVNLSTLYRNSEWIKKFEKFKNPTAI